MSSKSKTNVKTTDRELLEAITRELRAIYSDVIRQPLPPELAAALVRLECRAAIVSEPYQRPENPRLTQVRAAGPKVSNRTQTRLGLNIHTSTS